MPEHPQGWKSREPTHGVRGMPKGPLGTLPDRAPMTAIGFCPHCGSNARRSCSVSGVFACSECLFVWYDDRVGEIERSFSDYFQRS